MPDAGDKEADKYDDKYYDLDDGFIDDESIQDDDDVGAELGEGASHFYSEATSNNCSSI